MEGSVIINKTAMASLPQSPTLEPTSHMTLHTSLAPSTPEPGHTSAPASKDSSQLICRKSRIPRFLTPSTKPSTKPTTSNSKHLPVSAKLTKQSVQTPKLSPKTDELSTPLPQSVQTSKHIPKTSELSTALVEIPKVEPKSQPSLTKHAKYPRQDDHSSPAKATSVLKPVMSSTPTKDTDRKDVTKLEQPTKPLSDARKVSRMITGTTPLDAVIDCSAAPEWSEAASSSTPACVPRPHNLHITRRVGVDGVVIAWDPVEHDCVAGFHVVVGGRVVQHVRSPHRTKALVTALPLAGTFTVGLVAVAGDGRCSTPALVTQDRSRVYPQRAAPPRPHHRPTPTSL